MNVTFEVCRRDVDGFVKLFDELELLFKQHWCEVEQPDYPVEIDRDFYKSMYAQGRYVGILATHDNKLVGYNSFFLKRDPHHRQVNVATNDVYFLAPKYRNFLTATKLFNEAHAYLKSIGITMIRNGTKRKKDAGKLLRWLGYEETETLYEKVL